MTDRELLVLAAKAARYPVRGIAAQMVAYLPDDAPHLVIGNDRGGDSVWNPLTGDGDAFRLAGRLELDVMHRVVGGKRVEVLAAGGPLIQEFYEGEPYAAVRRAIVRAAAEVARKRATKETA